MHVSNSLYQWHSEHEQASSGKRLPEFMDDKLNFLVVNSVKVSDSKLRRHNLDTVCVKTKRNIIVDILINSTTKFALYSFDWYV